MKTNLRTIMLMVASAFAAAHVQAQQSNNVLAFGPFEASGFADMQGYQELKLPDNRWYVAYQGNRQTSPAWVEAAWAARAAQLCFTVNAKNFVELHYSFEKVAADDAQVGLLEDGAGAQLRQVAGPIFIPIYTPSRPPVTLDAPAKLAAIRCVIDGATLLDQTRLVSGDESLSHAKSLGMLVR